MKIVVSAVREGLEADVSPVFGRCAYFTFVDTETLEARSVPNAAQGASGGAGIQAAQYVVAQGAQAVLTGNVGPNAMDVLQAANIPVYPVAGGTVREAVEAFKAGKTQATGAATAPRDAGRGTQPAAGPGCGMAGRRGSCGMGGGGGGAGRECGR